MTDKEYFLNSYKVKYVYLAAVLPSSDNNLFMFNDQKSAFEYIKGFVAEEGVEIEIPVYVTEEDNVPRGYIFFDTLCLVFPIKNETNTNN